MGLKKLIEEGILNKINDEAIKKLNNFNGDLILYRKRILRKTEDGFSLELYSGELKYFNKDGTLQLRSYFL
jgi:hypothetical protein